VLQAEETGFYNGISSLEAGNPGHAQTPPPLTDAKSEKHLMLDFVHFPFAPLRKTISRKGCA
jgi:hypothetical protein